MDAAAALSDAAATLPLNELPAFVAAAAKQNNISYLSALDFAYDPLFFRIVSLAAKIEQKLSTATRDLSHIDLVHLGVPAAVGPSFQAALSIFPQVAAARSPADKLSALSEAVSAVQSARIAFPSRSALTVDRSSGSDQNQIVLSADLLLPILVLLIVRSPPLSLAANILFLKHFFDPPPQQSYLLASLEAAVLFLVTNNTKDLVSLSSLADRLFAASENGNVSDVSDIFSSHIQTHASSPISPNNLSLDLDILLDEQASLLEPNQESNQEPKHDLHVDLHSNHSDQPPKPNSDHLLVSARNNLGQTALWIAAHHAHHSVVSILLNHNADPNAPDYRGRTPLHALALSRSANQKENSVSLALTANILVDRGARTDLQDAAGATPLILAARSNAAAIIPILSPPIAAILNAQTSDGSSALHASHTFETTNTILSTHPSFTNTNIANNARLTPALFHAINANQGPLKALVQNALDPSGSVDLSITDVSDRSILHLATFDDAASIFLPILAAIKDTPLPTSVTHPNNRLPHINAPDIHGHLPIHYAAAAGNLSLVSAFLENGSSPIQHNLLSQSPAAVASSDTIRDMIEDHAVFASSPLNPSSSNASQSRVVARVVHTTITMSDLIFTIKSGHLPRDLSSITTIHRCLSDFGVLRSHLIMEHPETSIPDMLDLFNRPSWIPDLIASHYQSSAPASKTRLNTSRIIRKLIRRLDKFLEYILTHPTLRHHELLTEFLHVAEIDTYMIQLRTKTKLEYLHDTLRDTYNPVIDLDVSPSTTTSLYTPDARTRDMSSMVQYIQTEQDRLVVLNDAMRRVGVLSRAVGKLHHTISAHLRSITLLLMDTCISTFTDLSQPPSPPVSPSTPTTSSSLTSPTTVASSSSTLASLYSQRLVSPHIPVSTILFRYLTTHHLRSSIYHTTTIAPFFTESSDEISGYRQSLLYITQLVDEYYNTSNDVETASHRVDQIQHMMKSQSTPKSTNTGSSTITPSTATTMSTTTTTPSSVLYSGITDDLVNQLNASYTTYSSLKSHLDLISCKIQYTMHKLFGQPPSQSSPSSQRLKPSSSVVSISNTTTTELTDHGELEYNYRFHTSRVMRHLDDMVSQMLVWEVSMYQHVQSCLNSL